MGSSPSKPRPQEFQVGGMSTFAIRAHRVGGWRALRARGHVQDLLPTWLCPRQHSVQSVGFGVVVGPCGETA